MNEIPTSGGMPITLAASSFSPTANAMAVDGTSVYLTDAVADAVLQMPLGGGNVTKFAYSPEPRGIAVDEAYVYWADTQNGTILRAPSNGGDPTVLASNQNEPRGIAVNSTHVFWTNYSPNGELMRLAK